MGIAWLWYYTHSTNQESLTIANEYRAFTFYARWRSVCQWGHSLYSRYCAYRRQHIARQSLLALSDHLLQDIGMYRTGTDVKLEEVRRVKRPRNSATQLGPLVSSHTVHCSKSDGSSRAA